MRIFEKDELKILWPFYLEYFMASMLYVFPAFSVIYFLSIGLSAVQIGMIIAVAPLASLIFEIPTGAFADLYGRKLSVLVGYFLECSVMLSLFFFKNYFVLLLLFLILGIASTFSSGSKDAWVVDLINKKNKHLVHNFFTKMQTFIYSGLILSGILGAFLVKFFGLGIIWLASATSYFISIVLLSVFAKEVYVKKKIELADSFKNLKNQTSTALHYSYKHHVLFYLLLSIMVASISMSLQAAISWTPLLKEFGVQDYAFGYLWSGMSLMAAISPLFATKFMKKGKEKRFIVLALILCATVTSLILFVSSLVPALLILFISLLFGYSKNPVQSVYFHKFIPTKLRATISSVESMFLSIGLIISPPIAGFLVDNIGPKYTIFISAIVMIPAILLFSKIKE
ncbi:MAG: MFS transporter [Nanoarchaeota archaeon]